jgi:hypothetical protein
VSKKRVSTNKVSSRKTARARPALKRQHYAGLALGGAKSDRTCLAFLEYYPDQNKIFLNELVDKIKNEGELSADTLIIESLNKPQYKVKTLAINAPLTSPPCLEHKCSSAETCDSEEVEWMWQHYRRQLALKKNHKLFSPYTERWLDHYIATELEEPFPFTQTVGANTAPIWARAHYLKRNIDVSTIEVNPKVSLWRIGRALLLQKSHLRFHKHQIDGDAARRSILKELIDRDIAFLYEADFRLLVESIEAFDAFLCALTAVLQVKGQCEERPKDLPSTGGWIEIPKADIIW